MRQETNTCLCAKSGFPPDSLGSIRELSFNCLLLGSSLRLDENSILTPKQSGLCTDLSTAAAVLCVALNFSYVLDKQLDVDISAMTDEPMPPKIYVKS